MASTIETAAAWIVLTMPGTRYCVHTSLVKTNRDHIAGSS